MGYILVGTIIGGIIWGIVVNKVIENKGYEENWFWWGFFFGIFALIIALTKQSVNTTRVVIEGSTQVEEKNMETVSNNTLFEKVDIYSPVHISSWDIKKDNNLNMTLFVDFLNVSDKTISAVMFSTTGFNSFGDKVYIDEKDSFNIIGQDLNIEPGEYGKVNVTIKNKEIRKVDVKVKKVCFVDGTIIEKTTSKWVDTNQNPLIPQHLDCARRKNPQAKFYAVGKEEFWQCTCGFVNTTNKCKLCNIEETIALAFTKNNIDDTYQNYLKELELEKVADEEERRRNERLEEEYRLEREKRAKRNKNIIIVIVLISLMCALAASFLNFIIIPNNKYKKATDLMGAGEYEKAINIFEELNNYKNSSNHILECKYNKAQYHIEHGDYYIAYRTFLEIEAYKDVSEILSRFSLFPTVSIETLIDGSVETIKYSYDVNGNCIMERCTTSTSDVYISEYNYNNKNKCIEKVCTKLDGCIISTANYKYDDRGFCIKEIRMYYNDYVKDEIFDYTYDAYGNCIRRVQTLTNGTQATTEYNYDNNGNCIMQRLIDPDGNVNVANLYYDHNDNCIKKVSDGTETEYIYSDDGRYIVKEVWTNSSGKKRVKQYSDFVAFYNN